MRIVQIVKMEHIDGAAIINDKTDWNRIHNVYFSCVGIFAGEDRIGTSLRGNIVCQKYFSIMEIFFPGKKDFSFLRMEFYNVY